MATYRQLKERLNELFIQSKERGLTDEQIKLAKDGVVQGSNQHLSDKYEIIKLSDLIIQNRENYIKLNNALGLVLQYITDLLSPEPPPNWWSISTRNPSYAYRMKNIIGVEDLFKTAGYTKRSRDSLSFPEGDKKKPNRQLLASLATEILMAREECLAAHEGRITLLIDDNEKQHSPIVSNPSHYTGHTQYENVSPSYSRVGSYQPPVLSSQRQEPLEYQQQQQQQQHQQQWSPVTATASTSNRPIPKPRKNSKKRSDSASSSNGSSPLQSQRFSGPLSDHEQLNESFDESSRQQPPKQFGSGNNSAELVQQSESSSERATEKASMKQRMEDMKKKLQEFNKKQQQQPQILNDPSAPLHGILPTSFSTPKPQYTPLLQPDKPVFSNDPSLPINTVRSTSKTTIDPKKPFNFNMTTPPGSQTILELDETIVEEDVPVTPNKCPRCNGHLNESSICTYCNSPSSPLLQQTPIVKQCPVPVPRKRRTMVQQRPRQNDLTNAGPNAHVSPVNNSGPIAHVPPVNNSGPIAHVPPVNNLGPSISIPLVNNSGPNVPLSGSISQIAPLGPIAAVPDDTHNYMGSEPHNLRMSEDQSTLTNESHPDDSLLESTKTNQSYTTTENTNDIAVRCEALDHQFEKYSREGEYFSTLSLDEQDEYLDKKIDSCETVNHLKSYYKGRNWFARKEAREIKVFEKMNPRQQKEIIDQKTERKEKINHLAKYFNTPNANHRPFDDDKRNIEMQKKQRMTEEGMKFCEWIKICSRKGFKPKEVEIALSLDNDPLRFLQGKWQEHIKNVTARVRSHREKPGKPSYEEIRQHLINAKGTPKKAVENCIKERRAKIKGLEKLLAGRIEVERTVLIECLSEYQLDVDEAFYGIQRRNLSELYKYLGSSKDMIDSDGKKGDEKGKSDMDAMKQRVLEKTKEKEKEAYESCVRMLIAENKFKDDAKAIMLIDLLHENSDYPMKYYIDAVKHYDTLEDASRFLNQPCPICTDIFVMDDMVVMPACGCALCKECFVYNFEMVIKEKSIKHFNCPMCGKPDLSNEEQDMNIELFVAMVKEFCEKDTYDMCQKKLTEFNLSKQSNFVWCINEECRSGFLTDRVDRIRVECPNCSKDMCFLCKKKWEHQHEGITCDQFTQWKIDNDPEAQKQGLAAHLEENGIQCPGCKFRYDLARGGCMHFRCTQCPIEFCSGCGGTIKKGEECGRFESCKNMGLHAHHPRDCLFYLRDFSVEELQELLTEAEVPFDVDPHQAQLDAAREEQRLEVQDIEDGDGDGEDGDGDDGDRDDERQPRAIDEPVKLTCGVMLQKEGPNGLIDEKCGIPTPEKMAGLCKTHYTEYLVGKINKSKLDPLKLYPLHQFQQILKREGIDVPQKNEEEDETEDEYKERLKEHIEQVLPIQRETSLNFVARN